TMYATDDNKDRVPQRSQYCYTLSNDKIPKDEAEALSYLTGLGKLYPQYIRDPKIFYCPSQQDTTLSYDGEYGWNNNFPLKKNKFGNWIPISTSYTYLNVSPGISKPPSLI